jgi:hypothetical protein
MPNPSLIQIIAAVLFGLAIIHTFSTKFFEGLAYRYKTHAGLWHLLGEVEVVFGFWALVLCFAMFAIEGSEKTKAYINSRNFTEALFIFAIMVVAASRPILKTSMKTVQVLGKGAGQLLRLPGSMGQYFMTMTLVPLAGSFITEAAAMTVAALILSKQFFSQPGVSKKFKYFTLGVLFVNISIGGTLTSYAAPPVLIVSNAWGWDTPFMLSTFGTKAVVGVFINAVLACLFFYKDLAKLSPLLPTQGGALGSKPSNMPVALVLLHFIFLLGIVVFAHDPPLFMGVFLLFMGVSAAYQKYQDRLILREGLLVAFFLAGLVVLGGQQQWWLQPVVMGMENQTVFWATLALSAFVDNAAMAYMGSLIEGVTFGFQYALITAAVSGGGLTIIANAPNPAGGAILSKHFTNRSISPLGLLLGALVPTFIAVLAFQGPGWF